MKNILTSRLLAALFLSILWGLPILQGQNNPCKTLVPGGGETAGTFFFNYGSATNVRNLKYQSSLAFGMPLVGAHSSGTYFGSMGFWTRFIAPPGAPTVVATQGDLLDRIQVSWNLDGLSSAPENGFKIYRDGIFLAQVDKTVKNYNDFNVIAGRPYIYEVRGSNQYGNGAGGTALGFQVPNGVVTGWVQTVNSNPVPDALVTLMPMQGFSLKMGADQAAGVDNTGVNSFLPTHPDSTWSLCFWVKTQSVTGDAAIMSLTTPPVGLDFRGAVGGQPGIEVSYGGNVLLSKAFDTPGKNGWQHVAIIFEEGRYRLFINGILVALMPGSALPDTKDLLLGMLAGNGTGGWSGLLDELRIYHNVVLDELSLAEVMEGTASRFTAGLKYYWKMDEELGEKSFDVMNRRRLYFCNAKFDKDRPPVRTAGKTNEEGYYRIESANYGTGTTFLAQPMKNFYQHRALKFERNESDYATLPNFPVTPKSTLELWVNSGGPNGDQALVSKRWGGTNDFRLLLREDGINSRILFQLNGGEANFGLLGNNYQHLAFTIESGGGSTLVTAYKNGTLISTSNLPAISGNWSDPAEPWTLGARKSGVSRTDFYDGLLDEIALYDTTLAQTTIQTHAANSRNAQERGLRIYFSIDEGSGNRLNNSGSYLSGFGTTFGTTWTPLAPNQTTTPHVFAPRTRQVTLNPSITSVDQVDFTDRSTVAVSGFVRYDGTDCFVNRAEILVDGESFRPQIFTDSLGRFTIDFEPGTTAVLSAKYEKHNFIPAAWEVINLTSPLAGVLFSDVTKRKIEGQIAGGNCRKSIIEGPVTDCRVTVRTLDGCFERTDTVQVTNGKYKLNNLPPLEVTIAVSKHNNPTIYQYFQTLGGRRINLTQKDSIGSDFIYFAPPSVDVAGFESYYKICKGQTLPTLDVDGNPLIVIEELQPVKLDVTVYEQYGPGQNLSDRCPLDSAQLSISNTFDMKYNFLKPLDTLMRNKKFDYDFLAANPNPNPPYLQIMQVTADVDGRKGTYSRRALITGIIKGDKKFTTVAPMVPNFVLRDPPGDHSFAFLEKGTTICNTMRVENGGGAGPFFTLDAATGTNFGVNVPFAPTNKIKAQLGITSEFDLRVVRTDKTSMDYCITNNERISTDDGDLVVGGKTSLDGGKTILAGNDVYVGTAFNFIISDSRFLRFNDSTCNVKLNSVTTLESDTFATTYMYSEWNIENNVIRYLDSLILDGQNPNGIISQSKQRWLDFIKLNTEAKAKAKFKRNISWDAGVQYDYSETRDTTQQASLDVTTKFEGLLGFYLSADAESPVGGKIELKTGAKFEGTFIKETGEFKQKGTTVGYTLKDDDPGDTWTMDVKDDPIFKTPVFDIKAGQTSCPWEVGTARREGVKLISVDGNTRLNVPSNGEASFKFLLANNSQTGETFSYALTTGPESNPDGAQIFLNGGPLDKYVYYALPWRDGPLPVTITVKRGPTEYLYENMEIVFLSVCHDARANALGVAPDDDPILYSAVYITVQFEEPCSEVDISFPQDGWVVKPDNVNPATQDILPITISGYDKKDKDLLGIRLQYRPSDGNGAWINITSGMPDYIPKADLGDVFEVYFWDTGGTPPLSDGPYEIRAIALCSGAPTDNPGFSHIRQGRIDRQPPSIVGVPEPSDGVYNVGDEISFTFNKPINCNKLLEADIFNDNNVGLYDATTGKLIDIDISCYENKIILNPKFQNEFFENKVIRAELHNILDKTGNKLGYTDWEFIVDRNELAWLTDSMGLTKYDGEYKVGTAAIHNRGGYPVPFKITGVPSWVRVVPSAGTLVANQILPIRFEVDSTLAFGNWRDTIVLHTETGQNPFFMGGNEPLLIGVRVVCRPPNWKVNPNLFENTMNMVLQLDIQGSVSTDVEDIVAAYIGDQMRGSAYLEYAPEVNKYLAYLTIYGNPDDQLDPVRFEIWDASECLRYGSVVESYTFQPDNVVGFIGSPIVLHTNSLVLREVPFGFGWNWLSFNLAFPDNSLNAALASLNHPQNDLMKSQTAFSMYSGGWFGSLNNLGNKTMYIYRADVPDTLRMMGSLVNPATTNIPLVSGWNWIGYVPNYSLPTNEALSSLPSQPGDLIKGQLSFAQYFNSTFGWVGNLKYMSPPNGYQIKVATAGTLTYPPPRQHRGDPLEDSKAEEKPPVAFWNVNPAQYENSMTLIGMLKANNTNATTATMELGVFAGNEVRGSALAIYIPPLNAYQFFLTTYANSGGEQLKFKLFDSATGVVQDLSETMWFSPDLHQGSIESPVPFMLRTSGLYNLAAEQSFDVQPNPFSEETMLRFALSRSQEVTISIFEVSGQEVSRLRQQARSGLNTVTWDGTSDAGLRLNTGVYFVRLSTEEGIVTKKVVLQR